jgi:hypothetical protein
MQLQIRGGGVLLHLEQPSESEGSVEEARLQNAAPLE